MSLPAFREEVRGWLAEHLTGRFAALVGTGGAEKAQVHAMVQRILPGVAIAGPDAADALAVAITHAHHLASARAGVTR